MGMGMSSMSSGVREHVQKEITDLKTMINNEITGLKTEINNDNAEIYAGLLKAVDDKIATINEKMSMEVQMKATPRMIDDVTKPLREELKKLKDSNSNLQQTEITDKEALSVLKDHMNDIQRKFEHHVTHADVKELEERVLELEGIIASTKGMSPATLYEVPRKPPSNSSGLIKRARGAKMEQRLAPTRSDRSPQSERRAGFLEPIIEQGEQSQSQANKNPYLLFLE